MADAVNIRKLEAELWESADLLRQGSKLTSNQYCMPVLGLIFLRYAYGRYKAAEKEILKDRPMRGGRVLPVEASDFKEKSALYLPKEAQYEYLVNLPEDIASSGLENYRGEPMGSLGEVVNNAMELIEEQEEQLQGILPKNYTDFTDELLAELLRIFNNKALDDIGGDVIGRIYEYFLNKFAKNVASDDGVFFTPKSLVKMIVNVLEPKSGILLDPACGTFGFMIAAAQYVRDMTDDYADLTEELANFEVEEAFSGCELVHDTHRLALMNAMLHGIDGPIYLGDTLSDFGKRFKDYDVVLTNPPFGTKKGGERATRDDFTYTTSNKQLNFLQHIYRSLKANGKAHAAVVLPDNVLFADGDGQAIRRDLMEKCDLHTILRLPTGIFYAQGVKTNVLFFTSGTSDQGNTKEVWFYDLRTNMPSFGKTHPLKREDFAGFVAAYESDDRHRVADERWHSYTREEIAAKDDSLDLGLIKDDSIIDYENLPNPVESAESAIASLKEAVQLLQEVADELRATKEN